LISKAAKKIGRKRGFRSYQSKYENPSFPRVGFLVVGERKIGAFA